MTGTARYEATKIPEAIKYPRGLSLSGSWSGANGSHLTFVASEDFRQTATVVPSPPFLSGPGPEPVPLGKDALRLAAIDARKAFVATLSDAKRALLERRLGERLTALCADSKVVAGYAPIGSEISPLAAMEEARAVGAIVALDEHDEGIVALAHPLELVEDAAELEVVEGQLRGEGFHRA